MLKSFCSAFQLFSLCCGVHSPRRNNQFITLGSVFWRLDFLYLIRLWTISFKAFHEGLRELGYIEGKNIFIEYRYSQRQSGRLLEFAEELVRLKVKVIVAPNTASIEAAKQSTSKIPIVMLSAPDPVPGFVDSLGAARRKHHGNEWFRFRS